MIVTGPGDPVFQGSIMLNSRLQQQLTILIPGSWAVMVQKRDANARVRGCSEAQTELIIETSKATIVTLLQCHLRCIHVGHVKRSLTPLFATFNGLRMYFSLPILPPIIWVYFCDITIKTLPISDFTIMGVSFVYIIKLQ